MIFFEKCLCWQLYLLDPKMRISICFLYLVSLFVAIAGNAQSHVERHGYITSLTPPARFQLGTQQVLTDKHTQIYDLANKSNDPISFSTDAIPPGTHVFVSGKEDAQTRLLLAKRIELVDDKSQIHFAGTGQEDRSPALTHEGNGWRGKVYADGYAIFVDPATSVIFPVNIADPMAFHPDWRVHYEATRQSDASILAKKISFAVDEHQADEQEYRTENDFNIDLPDYDKGTRGTVHFFLHSFHIVPNKALNEKVTAIGESLIPEWQKHLDDKDPAKVHFRFFVLEPTKFSSIVSNDAGTILVPVNVLVKLTSDAQLASLLSANIASSIEGTEYHSRSHKHAEQALNIGMGAIPFGAGFAGQLMNDQIYSDSYWKPITERMYRVGMGYMVSAYYDLRQAPVAQQRIAEKHPDNQNHPNWLSEYIDAEIAFSYSNTDFTNLRTGETEYAALLALAHAADPKNNNHD